MVKVPTQDPPAILSRTTKCSQTTIWETLLYTNDCTSKDPSVKLLKLADDTTLISLIQDGDESAYRHEVKELTVWCSLNNLELNTLKTGEMIMNFTRNPPALPPLTIINSTVTAVESFRFLGTIISQDLKWDNHIDSIIKRAEKVQPELRKFNLPQELLKQFYSAIIESVLCTSITVWFSSATKSDLRRLRRVVRTAERIIGTTLPTLQELYVSRVRKRSGKITLDPHIQHTPSLMCYRLIDDTELWAPERPDTGTVSSLRQSISWTLVTKRGTHNTHYYISFVHHTYLLFFSSHIHFNLQMSYLCIHNCLYYILCLCFFVISYSLFVHYVYYLCSVLSLSFCVTVELLSL